MIIIYRLPVESAERNAFQPASITNQFQKLKLNTGTNQSYVRGGQVFQPSPGINKFKPPQSTGSYQQQAVGSQKTVQPPPGFEHIQPLPGFKHLQPHPGFKQIGPPPGFGCNINRLLSQSSITQPKTQ